MIFIVLTHYVSDSEFNIFISYNPSLFDIATLVFEICKRPKKVTLAAMIGKLIGPWLKEEITLNLHLTTLKKRLLFQLFNEKNGLFLVFVWRLSKYLGWKKLDNRYKRKGEGATIKIVANQSTINVNEQLKVLNDLYIKHGIKDYGFNNFILKEIISI